MAQNTKIPDILASFDEALVASVQLRDTFARIGETNLQAIAERNITSLTKARTEFLSIVEPRELRRPVDVTDRIEAQL